MLGSLGSKNFRGLGCNLKRDRLPWLLVIALLDLSTCRSTPFRFLSCTTFCALLLLLFQQGICDAAQRRSTTLNSLNTFNRSSYGCIENSLLLLDTVERKRNRPEQISLLSMLVPFHATAAYLKCTSNKKGNLAY